MIRIGQGLMYQSNIWEHVKDSMKNAWFLDGPISPLFASFMFSIHLICMQLYSWGLRLNQNMNADFGLISDNKNKETQ